MSDIGQENVLIIRSHRRRKRFIGIVCMVCALALFVALILWSIRPQWDTFVSRPTRSAPAYRLAVQVPVGWDCREANDAPDCTLIRIHRKTLTGWAQWWQEHVLRTGVTQDTEEQCMISLTYFQAAASSNDADYYRFLVAGMLESSPSTCRTYEHPLGSALERTYGQEGAVRDYVTRIVVRQHPKGQRLEVIAGLSGANAKLSRTHPEWEQIVRRLRVVQK